MIWLRADLLLDGTRQGVEGQLVPPVLHGREAGGDGA